MQVRRACGEGRKDLFAETLVELDGGGDANAGVPVAVLKDTRINFVIAERCPEVELLAGKCAGAEFALGLIDNLREVRLVDIDTGFRRQRLDGRRNRPDLIVGRF